jgi:hypothetical protein
MYQLQGTGQYLLEILNCLGLPGWVFNDKLSTAYLTSFQLEGHARVEWEDDIPEYTHEKRENPK